MMKATYPIIVHPQDETGYHFVEIPDFDGYTQGKDLNECIEMAQDYINLKVIDCEDNDTTVPSPTNLNTIGHDSEVIVTLVVIDTIKYRQENSTQLVKKTLTIPMWLNEKAEKNNVNFSKTLQNALIEQLY